MDQYMAAADLMVGKAGGLTTSEALAGVLPMALIEPIPGQEESNSDHLLEARGASRCHNLPAAAWKIASLLDDSARLAPMAEAVKSPGAGAAHGAHRTDPWPGRTQLRSFARSRSGDSLQQFARGCMENCVIAG